MVDVQVRAHDVVDVVDGEPGGGESLLEAVGVHHVPHRPRRPRLVVADAGIDQDVVVRRLDHEALHAKHELAGLRIEGCGRALEPGTVLRQQFLRQRREEFERVEERPLLLDHGMDGDILESDGGHGAGPC
jgi:hypothetical protein